MPKARVTVRLKPSLLDSAGRAVADSLTGLGYSEVKEARIGKIIELDVDSFDRPRIEEMCAKLLANPVIEDFTIEEAGE